MKLVHYVIVQFLKHSPEAELIDLKQELEDVFNRKVSVPTTQRILKKLGWLENTNSFSNQKIYCRKYDAIFGLYSIHSTD